MVKQEHVTSFHMLTKACQLVSVTLYVVVQCCKADVDASSTRQHNQWLVGYSGWPTHALFIPMYARTPQIHH